ncbi:MAG TPA: hypothetical protein VHC95_10655 [Opitutales bacterium]|nr:hypothetical protein [Opitutales bacterium]
MSDQTPVEPPAPARRTRWLARAIVVLEPLSVALGFIFMLEKSWMRWGDPLIDFPRDLYIAWRMSEGDLLYERIANWYGPLANLVEAAGFRLFGAGLDTLVWMNIALSVGILLLLRGIFGLIGNRLMVWLCSLLFVFVFLVGHYNPFANYNYLTPYVAQSSYSFAGLLLVLWGLLKNLKTGRAGWLGVAGFGFAVAYLDKPEAVLAAGGSLIFYLAAQCLKQAHANCSARRWLAGAVGWLAGGFFTLWLPVFLFLVAQGGLVYAVRAANFVLVSVLDRSIRDTALNSQSLAHFAGFDQPWANFVMQLEMGAVLVLVCALIILAGRLWSRVPRFSPAWWLLPVVAAGCAVAGVWLAVLSNEDFHRALVFPVAVASAIYAVRGLRAARRNEPGYARLAALAVVGLAATLMMARIFLNVRAGYYGFFMAPLAAFFWLDLLVVEAARPHSADLRPPRLVAVVFALVIAAECTNAARLNLTIYQYKTFAIGEGRDRFLTASETSFPYGWMLSDMLEACRKYAPHARSLVVFPEGAAVNYHLRLPTPLAELEFQPIALNYAGPQHVLDELKAHPPDVVLVYSREMEEFGVKYFGADRASGRDILEWLNDHYVIALRYRTASNTAPVYTANGDVIDLLLPKAAGAQGDRFLPQGP